METQQDSEKNRFYQMDYLWKFLSEGGMLVGEGQVIRRGRGGSFRRSPGSHNRGIHRGACGVLTGVILSVGHGESPVGGLHAVIFYPEEIGARREVLPVETDVLFAGGEGSQLLADEPASPEVVNIQGVNARFRSGEAESTCVLERIREEGSHGGGGARPGMCAGRGVDFRDFHGDRGDGLWGEEDRVGGHGERHPVVGGRGAGDEGLVDGIAGNGGFQSVVCAGGGVDGHQGGGVAAGAQEGHGFHHKGGGVDLHPFPSGVDIRRELLENPVVLGALVPFAFVGPLVDIPGEVDVHESSVGPDEVPEEIRHGILVVERLIDHASQGEPFAAAVFGLEVGNLGAVGAHFPEIGRVPGVGLIGAVVQVMRNAVELVDVEGVDIPLHPIRRLTEIADAHAFGTQQQGDAASFLKGVVNGIKGFVIAGDGVGGVDGFRRIQQTRLIGGFEVGFILDAHIFGIDSVFVIVVERLFPPGGETGIVEVNLSLSKRVFQGAAVVFVFVAFQRGGGPPGGRQHVDGVAQRFLRRLVELLHLSDHGVVIAVGVPYPEDVKTQLLEDDIVDLGLFGVGGEPPFVVSQGGTPAHHGLDTLIRLEIDQGVGHLLGGDFSGHTGRKHGN